MTVIIKGISKDEAINNIALRFGSNEEWAKALVATFVEFGMIKFENSQSFREIKQEIKNGPAVNG